jgi:hypothetical protein
LNLVPLAPLLVKRSPYALSLSVRLWGIHVPGPQRSFTTSRILSWASAPLQRCPSTEPLHRAFGYPTARRPVSPKRLFATPPLRFLPLQRFPHSEQRLFGRACLTQPPASSGFLNLLTLCSAPSLPAVFHAGSALGVCPPELSSSRAAVRRFRRPSPLDVSATL